MDIHEVAALLHIAEKSNQWPRLKPIHDEVMRMLEAHAEETKVNAAKRAESAKEVPVEARDPDNEQAEEGEEEVQRRQV